MRKLHLNFFKCVHYACLHMYAKAYFTVCKLYLNFFKYVSSTFACVCTCTADIDTGCLFQSLCTSFNEAESPSELTQSPQPVCLGDPVSILPSTAPPLTPL